MVLYSIYNFSAFQPLKHRMNPMCATLIILEITDGLYLKV